MADKKLDLKTGTYFQEGVYTVLPYKLTPVEEIQDVRTIIVYKYFVLYGVHNHAGYARWVEPKNDIVFLTYKIDEKIENLRQLEKDLAEDATLLDYKLIETIKKTWDTPGWDVKTNGWDIKNSKQENL